MRERWRGRREQNEIKGKEENRTLMVREEKERVNGGKGKG